MYAIVEVGNRQFKVAENDRILIERSLSPHTRRFSLDKVLLIVKDRNIKIGRPYLKDSKINCEVVAHVKDKKKIAFKFRRRKSFQFKKGHRQKLILAKVKEIKAVL